MPAGFHQNFIKVQATMDDSTQHQHYGYHQNIMQANQQIGQQPQTFNPMEHFWFANLSPSSEEEQQSQMGDESLSFSSAGTLLPSPAQSLSSSSAFSSACTLLPSPADLDIGTSATSLLQTVYQSNRNLNQQLQVLNQKVEEVKTDAVRVTGNHEKLLSWTYKINIALKTMGERLVEFDADLKNLRGQLNEKMSRLDEAQKE
ncbi:hypothetical protein VE02_05621 [Pseudogymnoascus sp. 03VT05]|nr:hypothetical protein VE02_05621 [Pseudogymnoascus sp. 03VT05]